MAIETTCEGCGRRLQVGAEHAGQKVRCPVCDTLNQTPTVEQFEASRASAAAASSSESPPNEALPSETPPTETPAQESESPVITAEPAPPPDNTPWWMTTPEGPTYGPIPKADLDRWVREGRVDDNCTLRRGEAGPWQPAAVIYPSLQTTTSPAPRGQTAPQPAPPSQQPTTTPLSSGGRTYLMPGRGSLILTLGILGWFTCPIFGVMAWVMGTSDLKEMSDGRMDPATIGATQAGRILGMLCSIFWIVSLVAIMFVFIYIVSV